MFNVTVKFNYESQMHYFLLRSYITRSSDSMERPVHILQMSYTGEK